MINNHFTRFAASSLFLILSSSAFAHLNVAPENAIAVGDGSRQYKEGSSAFVGINISHDCSNDAGEHFATTGVSVLLPNAANIDGTYTSGSGGAQHGANAVMGVKQRMNSTFRKNIVVRGDVGPFYNHGLNTNDARALKWLKGKVDNDHYDNLEFKATFPKIDPASCISKIRMFFPSMQYCQNDYKLAWIRTAESKWGMGDEKTHIYNTYAAYLDVVRTSELPASCGDGEVVEVMPSVEEINHFLDNRVSNHRHSDH